MSFSKNAEHQGVGTEAKQQKQNNFQAIQIMEKKRQLSISGFGPGGITIWEKSETQTSYCVTGESLCVLKILM